MHQTNILLHGLLATHIRPNLALPSNEVRVSLVQESNKRLQHLPFLRLNLQHAIKLRL